MTVRPQSETLSDRPQECVGLTHWTQCEPLNQPPVKRLKDHFLIVSVVKLRLEKAIANILLKSLNEINALQLED